MKVPETYAAQSVSQKMSGSTEENRLNDTDTVPRLLAEREHAKMLRMKFPHLKEGDKFSIGDLNDYLARLGMAAELRHRRDVLDSLNPENRWSRRQFEDAFNAVREPVAGAQRSASDLSAERCAKLAGLRELFLDHWIELVGWGIGRHESYDIGDGGVSFRDWEDEFISAAPVTWQAEMKRDNRTAPHLEFPCTPAELVKFVDTAIGIHCFMVPDAFRLAVASHAQAERCNELAKLPELFVHHWEELTGIGICKGGAYTVSQSGVYPEQYSDDDLRSLFPEERRVLLEAATRPPLPFPCTPSQLLKFVDGGWSEEFEIPDHFRAAVEPPALPVQSEGKLSADEGLALARGVSSGAPRSDDRPRFCPRVGWQIALFDAWPAICKLYGGREPTPTEAIRYLRENDTSGAILNRPDSTVLWWKTQQGATRDVALKTVQNTISAWRVRGVLPA